MQQIKQRQAKIMEIAKCCKAKSTDFKYQIRINYKLNNS